MRLLHRSALGAAALMTLIGLAACSSPSDPGTPTSGPAPTTTSPMSATQPPEPSLDGTIFLLDPSNGLYSLRDGVLTLIHADSSFEFYQTVAVSPDGTLFAYVSSGEEPPTGSGQLSVQPVSGGPARLVGPDTISNGGPPLWAPDSGSVIVGEGRLDVESGTMTPWPGACRPSADFTFAICLEPPAPFTYTVVRIDDPSSGVPADPASGVPAVPPAGMIFGVGDGIQSLSPDGRHVIAWVQSPDDPWGDFARDFGANAIVDTRTGASVPIPGGGTLRAGFYLADGNAVLRVEAGGVDTIVLASPAGAVLDEVTVPAAAADLLLLGYAPALG